MLIPIKDDNPLRIIRFQLVTGSLIGINLLVYLLTGALAGEQALGMIAMGFGVVPNEVINSSGINPGSFHPVTEPLTLLTYQFLHGSWMHVISNMVILWILGDNIEDSYGHVAFLIFYLLCGVIAGLTHVAMSPGSNVPLVGASGAGAGVMGAYLLLYPKARILILISYFIPFRVPAFVLLVGWLALQFVNLRAPQVGEQAVAWWAHIGGFAAGLVLTFIWTRFRRIN